MNKYEIVCLKTTRRMGGAEKLTANGCKMHNKMQVNDERIEKLNIAVFSPIFLLAMLLIWAGPTVTGPPGTNKVI